MTPSKLIAFTVSLLSVTTTTGFSFVASSPRTTLTTTPSNTIIQQTHSSSAKTSPLQMIVVDPTYVQGAGVAVAGLLSGFGLLSFTEKQGERSMERGSVSSELQTQMSGMMMEDIEVNTVNDLGGLTSQLENALKENSSDYTEVELTDAEKKKIAEDLDDGW
mmetsp:Transcript_35976/g.42968  ORF Transcript_35976/g.42968 Transcript_35976/m.42968 type:complete len:162 (-) Transcript_35976:133-618(-)|eukprot:CAMPEP_0198262134 /NCGR_PEP_ID=MMETSP1447-20131203/10690_1 /TAXON_ID=420782 /ORGANISM="Chaetoceros dichaeta, Strain CCMP1751" /LENGTH=161 /DNA_ID=CAMNT_0043950269 /DNA_START=145 /DNA_END=630 /DNA_ORIENTATION=+